MYVGKSRMARKPARSATSSNRAPAGIPRTHRAAQKLGYKRVHINFSNLPDAHKAQFVQLTQSGTRPGALCGIAPSTDDGYWLVCYKLDGKQCTWMHVPKDQPVKDHG